MQRALSLSAKRLVPRHHLPLTRALPSSLWMVGRQHSSICFSCTPAAYDARRPTTATTTSSSAAAASADGKTSVHYSKLGMDGFNDLKFNNAADDFLQKIEDVLDALESDQIEDLTGGGGVLNVELAGGRGAYLLNKQAPNVQLWLSSPVSGPHHYDMFIEKQKEDGEEVIVWRDDKDHHSLQQRLEEELSKALGTAIRLS